MSRSKPVEAVYDGSLLQKRGRRLQPRPTCLSLPSFGSTACSRFRSLRSRRRGTRVGSVATLVTSPQRR
eukprot:6199192-Pleurochrysis_carterae.AAC.5